MTREEEINNAKNAFNERIIEEKSYYDPRDCFEEGAEWADSHPLNVWHDASDIPNDDSLIIYESVYGDILLKRFTNRASAMANVLRWAYIDTILHKAMI